MIKVISDPSNLVQEKEIFLTNISDYPLWVNEIHSAVSRGKELEIYVSQQNILHWLKNMALRYPQGTFEFGLIDAKSALSKKWGKTIPEYVSNEDIIKSNLLQFDIPIQPGYGFMDIILAYFYSPVFAAPSFPLQQLDKIIMAYEKGKWDANRQNALLAKILESRIDEWRAKASSSEQRRVIDLYREDPLKLKHILMEYRILQKYPEIGEAILAKNYQVFRALKLPAGEIEVNEGELTNAITQITYWLNIQEPTTPEDFISLLDHVSGLLNVEFELVEKILRKHTEWITPDIMVKVEAAFISGRSKFTNRIRQLRAQIRPVKPVYPDIGWKFEEMLDWVITSYLPYQAWCDHNDQFEVDLFDVGDRFSEWLIKNWNDIHQNSKRMVFNILPKQADMLRKRDRVDLILVIDNFGWANSVALQKLFEAEKLFVTTSEPYFAMLPTETEISKKCLLSGSVGYTDIDETGYKGIIEKGWVPYFQDASFRYIMDLGSLKKVENIDATTYVVNYLAIDNALHKSADELGIPHMEQINTYLLFIVRELTTFIQKHGLEKKIRIHIVSDHGSTRIPSSMKNDIDMLFFKGEGFEGLSHRFVKVNQAHFTSLADNFRQDCFFLPANDFHNPYNALCARRSNRFLATDERSYVHGGLLPEEVIVPYLIFEPAIVQLKDLTIQLLGKVFRYRKEMVRLEIGNPNDFPVENIHISILNRDIEFEPIVLQQMEGKRKTSNIELTAWFKKTTLIEENPTIHFRLEYEGRGEYRSQTTSMEIELKSMFDDKSTGVFDD